MRTDELIEKPSEYFTCHHCGNTIFRPNTPSCAVDCPSCGGSAIRLSVWKVVTTLSIARNEIAHWRDVTGNMTPEECAEDIREATLLEQEAEQRYTRLDNEYQKHLAACTPCKHERYVRGQE